MSHEDPKKSAAQNPYAAITIDGKVGKVTVVDCRLPEMRAIDVTTNGSANDLLAERNDHSSQRPAETAAWEVLMYYRDAPPKNLDALLEHIRLLDSPSNETREGALARIRKFLAELGGAMGVEYVKSKIKTHLGIDL